MEIIDLIMLGLLGILILFILGGILYGAMRGAKRTGIRILTLVMFFLLALFLTPVVSSMIYNMKIKLPVDGGKTAKELMDSFVNGSEVTENAVETMPALAEFVNNFPLVILNLIVFILLFFVFKGISYIVYKVIVGQVLPKYDENNEKVEHSKKWGMMVGAAQGLLLFLFFFVPVNGLMYFFNEIETYNPSLAAISATTDEEVSLGEFHLEDINKFAHDANKSIQNSPIGVITKYTGAQFLSNVAIGSLCTVKAGDTQVNIKNDAVTMLKLSKDAMAVSKFIDGLENDITHITPRDYKEIKKIINRFFDVKIINLALNAEFAEFARKQDILKEAGDFLPDKDAVQQAEFNEAVYTAASEINAKFIKEDLLAIVDIMEMVFTTHVVTTSEISGNFNLFKRLDALIYAINNKENMEEAFLDLHAVLTSVKYNGVELGNKLLGKVAELNIFKKVLFNAENTGLYTIPLGQLADMAREDVEITDLTALFNGFADIIEDICLLGPAVIDIVDNASDLEKIIDILTDNNAIQSVGHILETITNPGMGTDKVSRKFLLDQLENLDNINNTFMETLIESIKEQLENPDEDIAWTETLTTLCSMVQAINDLYNQPITEVENINLDYLINSDLIEIVLGNEIIKQIVADLVEEYIKEFVGETDPQAAIETYLGGLADAELEDALRKLFDFL